MKKTLLPIIAVGFATTLSSQAAVLITQYYEGSSFNKWIELTNTGTSSVDLDAGDYNFSLWQNANTEAYKTDGTPSQTLDLVGTLNAGESLLLSHTSAAGPGYATADVTSGTVINHNGDDSFTLWTGSTFSTASIVDAIGFTDAGNEGADTSIVRLSSAAGWDTNALSTYLDFGSVWGDIGTAAADSALAGTDARLGFSPISIPEPSAALLGGLGVLALLRRRNR